MFGEFEDGSGVLFHSYSGEWHIWSDPLCDRGNAIDRVDEFSKLAFGEGIEKVWLKYVSDYLHPKLSARKDLKVNKIDYTLHWPVLNMEIYDPALPGGHFKEIRNAQSKFNREHSLKVYDFKNEHKEALCKVVDDWRKIAILKEDESYVYDSWYRGAIDAGFRGFKTARVLEVDGRIVGINAGYEVVNNPQRFAGTIGIQDYSIKDMGLMLWLEDLNWIKKNGYKELDMQGDEMGEKIKIKLRFGAKIERKTDTFLVVKK